jgi:hypothetical protein
MRLGVGVVIACMSAIPPDLKLVEMEEREHVGIELSVRWTTITRAIVAQGNMLVIGCYALGCAVSKT